MMAHTNTDFWTPGESDVQPMRTYRARSEQLTPAIARSPGLFSASIIQRHPQKSNRIQANPANQKGFFLEIPRGRRRITALPAGESDPAGPFPRRFL